MGTFVDDLLAFGAKVGLYVIFMGTFVTIVRILQRVFPQSVLNLANPLHRCINTCVNAREALDHDEASATKTSASDVEETPLKRGIILAGCALGLQTAYLTWGVLQEALMTTEYDGEVFTSSQFLVFSNRMVAMFVAIIILNVVVQPPFLAPVYKFCFASFSNVMSSFCQYEALKFVTFPTQVIFKSSKMIPVMIMGKIIDRKVYTVTDYALAVVISTGVAIFTLSDSDDAGSDEKTTTLSGLIYLFGYICFDSFTSQWQGSLFRTYKMSPYQMMAGINLFSATFTLMSLLISGEMWYSLAFASAHPKAMVHMTVLSLCGACGQLLIFYTIKKFGPLVFTIIMATRQLIATILSAFIYGHHIGLGGLLGASIVFGAVGVNIWWKDRVRKNAKAAAAAAAAASRGGEDGTESSKLVKSDSRV